MIEKAAILLSQLWVAVVLTGSIAAGATEATGPALQPQALNWAGVYNLRQIDPNLTGAGVRVGVVCRSLTYVDGNPQNDYQPNTRHASFRNAQLQFHDSQTLVARESAHSTAVCSILFGDDPAGITPYLDPFSYQGVVPAAEGHVYELIHFVTQNVHPQEAPKVDVATASFGQELEDWWTRGIEALIEHQGMVFVASIGNGSNASEPPFYPGAGANSIGVGVVSSVSAVNPATKMRTLSWICGAARPIPEYSPIVSNMSSMSRWMRALLISPGGTALAFVRSTGCPMRATLRIDIP